MRVSQTKGTETDSHHLRDTAPLFDPRDNPFLSCETKLFVHLWKDLVFTAGALSVNLGLPFLERHHLLSYLVGILPIGGALEIGLPVRSTQTGLKVLSSEISESVEVPLSSGRSLKSLTRPDASLDLIRPSSVETLQVMPKTSISSENLRASP